MGQLVIDWKFLIPLLISLVTAIVMGIWNAIQQKQIERLKAENLKSVHVHRLQFEKEFEIYNKLWENLVELSLTVKSLRPRGEFVDPKKTKEEIINEKHTEFRKYYNLVVNMVYKNRPFYSKEVFEALELLITKSKFEFMEVLSNPDKKSHEYWEGGEITFNEVTRMIDNICEEIRKRIGLLEVK